MKILSCSVVLFWCVACGDGSSGDEGGGAAGSASGGAASGGSTSGTGGDFYLCEGVPPGTVVQVVVQEAVSEGMCLLEVTVVGAGVTLEPSCEPRNASACACTVDLQEGSYEISVEHADGRSGTLDYDYVPPECGDVEVQVQLNDELATDDCNLLCDSYEICPETSLGRFCIGGCCVEE